MIIFKLARDLQKHLEKQREQNLSIGFIPTMGALHQGHLSLLKAASNHNDLTVCSVFVNPTQFNDLTDFEKYPVTIEKDIQMLEEQDCDVVFLPSVKEIYPSGIDNPRHYDIGYLEKILEGAHRPGHFHGVCMVVEKLLSIVQPNDVYLGQKDFQQVLVIKKLVEIMGLTERMTIHTCPILREPGGLAMSSRNKRLDPTQLITAQAIYQALLHLHRDIGKGTLAEIKKNALKELKEKGFKVDYVEIADEKTLKPINEWDARKNAVGLVAAQLGQVRLIDNMLLGRD
jgi:pantoate--beta-alanine ligase